MDLQPHRGDDRVAVPVTFDVKSSTLTLRMIRLYIAAAVMVLDIILWIVVMFIAASDNIRISASVIAWVIVPLICRFAIVEEYKYRKNFKLLKEHDYTYDYSLFWTVFDTSPSFPTIFYHVSGMNSVFVAFDKDVIVGKGADSDFDHFEAISYAYQLMARKGINCIHIDYMDSVGKDSRLQGMFEDAAKCENPELKDCILDMLDYMQYNMSDHYSDYDVYCFTSKMRPDLFLDELEPILNAFDNGNYIRHRILDRQDVRDLVASVFSLPDFSVTRTCDSLFANRGYSSYIKVIWTERDGKREIVNKTRRQLAEEARIAAEEKEARKHSRRNRNQKSDTQVDLFGSTSAASSGAENFQNNLRGTQTAQTGAQRTPQGTMQGEQRQSIQGTSTQRPAIQNTQASPISTQKIPSQGFPAQRGVQTARPQGIPAQQGTKIGANATQSATGQARPTAQGITGQARTTTQGTPAQRPIQRGTGVVQAPVQNTGITTKPPVSSPDDDSFDLFN